ncbi:gamma-type small acid-soluble spore protein [Paenisporosarcina sp.]|uniref:gamma-type small acid-soluble spore protein n=1 Tax=Paenisporosarcina sp. TaxID=1932001 RepID=UPI003C74E981
MANKNNSNQPTNAAEVRKQNQQSTQKTAAPQANAYNTEFASEFAPKTNATEVRNQNQQSAQKAAQPQGGTNNRTEFGAEFASQTNPTEVKKQNQQSAQKASYRNNNSTK